MTGTGMWQTIFYQRFSQSRFVVSRTASAPVCNNFANDLSIRDFVLYGRRKATSQPEKLHTLDVYFRNMGDPKLCYL